MTKGLYIRIEEDLKQEAKKLALEKGKSLQKLVTEILASYISQNTRESTVSRDRPNGK